MIEKNEKSGELMEVKEQAKTVRKHPERMIVRIWLVLALICLLAGLIAQYTFRLKEPLFLHYSQSAYLGCGLDGVETSEDGIVSSVSSEALEEESTDSDVKVGVLDEGVKDLNRMNFRSAEIDLHICRFYAEKRGLLCIFMRNVTLNYGL